MMRAPSCRQQPNFESTLLWCKNERERQTMPIRMESNYLPAPAEHESRRYVYAPKFVRLRTIDRSREEAVLGLTTWIDFTRSKSKHVVEASFISKNIHAERKIYIHTIVNFSHWKWSYGSEVKGKFETFKHSLQFSRARRFVNQDLGNMIFPRPLNCPETSLNDWLSRPQEIQCPVQ